MGELFPMLKPVPSPMSPSDFYFAEDDVRAKATLVVNLDSDAGICGGILAVLHDENEFAVSFVVLRLVIREEGKPGLFERVFHGNGFGGELRELRHTFWGEPDNSGYIFYPSASLITDAFAQLARWFDDN